MPLMSCERGECDMSYFDPPAASAVDPYVDGSRVDRSQFNSDLHSFYFPGRVRVTLDRGGGR